MNHLDATITTGQTDQSDRRFEVIIPVRNGGDVLARSIQKILSPANERSVLLTLSDNHSTDGSPWKEALKNYAPERWRIITPPQSLGRVEHWTWAFDQAKLPWVKPLMVGDRTEDTFWDWVTSAIPQFPQAGIFFSNSYVIDPNSAHPDSNGVATTPHQHNDLYEYQAFMHDAVRCFNRIGALSQALLRADIMRAALPFEPEFPWTADWRFCKRCLEKGPAIHNQARMICLDRSIVRLSTSWKGIRGSFGEDWDFASRQAAALGEPAWKALFLRSRAIGTKMVFSVGRLALPRSVRGFLTSATGIHRKRKPV